MENGLGRTRRLLGWPSAGEGFGLLPMPCPACLGQLHSVKPATAQTVAPLTGSQLAALGRLVDRFGWDVEAQACDGCDEVFTVERS